jgi:hypothetical protein
MSDKFGYDPMVRLHEPYEKNVFIEIAGDADIPELLCISSRHNSESLEYFGDFSITMSTEKARQFAQAIISVANLLDDNPV